MEQPVRILHVVSIMDAGGIETLLMNLYRKIDRSKIQFDFLVQHEQKGFYEDEIMALGGRIYRVRYVTKVGPWKYMKTLTTFFKNHLEYSVVHSHLNTISGLILQSAQKAGVPVRIAHSHTSNTKCGFAESLFKNYYCKRKIPRVATNFFACSIDAGKWLFEDKITTTSLVIVKNGVDVDKFKYNEKIRLQMRKQLDLPENALVIGHVGRFHPLKNHDFLVDVFSELYNAVLLLIGDGKLKGQIMKKVHNLGLDNVVQFLGIRSDVNKLMQAMDIFLFPSKYEGLGIVIIEAQVAGLPCFISDAIPVEANIKEDLITRKSLSQTAKEWASAILNNLQYKRVQSIEAITRSGYKIEDTARMLQEFYLCNR